MRMLTSVGMVPLEGGTSAWRSDPHPGEAAEGGEGDLGGALIPEWLPGEPAKALTGHGREVKSQPTALKHVGAGGF